MNLGFIGTGNMGGPMATNLLKAGHSLTVHDIRREAATPLLEMGAKWASTPQAVAAASEITFTSLPGPKEMEAVTLGDGGILQGAKRGSVYVDMTTNSPVVTRRIHAAFKAKGIHMLDAPVSGGVHGAASRNLAVMVGGDKAVYQRIKPVLDAIGDKVFYSGEIGCGQICKLVHNCIGGILMQAISETFVLGVKAGVEPRALWETVRRGSVGRMAIMHYGFPASSFRGDFKARFAIKLARKDVGLATEMGREFNVPLPLGSLAEQRLVEAINRGWGDDDSTSIIRLAEEAGGAEVRIPDLTEADLGPPPATR